MNGHLQQSRLRKLWKDYGNIVYCLPVILGIIIFTLIPMVYSLIYAFCDYNFYYADNLVVISGVTSSRNRRAFERLFDKQINNQQPLEVKTKNINAQMISEGGGDVLWDILYKDDKYYVVWKECFSE